MAVTEKKIKPVAAFFIFQFSNFHIFEFSHFPFDLKKKGVSTLISFILILHLAGSFLK